MEAKRIVPVEALEEPAPAPVSRHENALARLLDVVFMDTAGLAPYVAPLA